MEKNEKLLISMRFFLLGRKYFKALSAFELGLKVHCGLRKDNKTPEFMHQIEIASYLRTIESGLMFPEDTFCVAFLHDIVEDYDYSLTELKQAFGDTVCSAVERLTKQYRGRKVDEVSLFEKMSDCPMASVVKGADRFHNFSSMIGVFSKEKQIQYIDECERLITPMLKRARRNFPSQEPVYENLKIVLGTQTGLIKLILANN